jgi:hypothetical protein
MNQNICVDILDILVFDRRIVAMSRIAQGPAWQRAAGKVLVLLTEKAKEKAKATSLMKNNLKQMLNCAQGNTCDRRMNQNICVDILDILVFDRRIVAMSRIAQGPAWQRAAGKVLVLLTEKAKEKAKATS